MNREPHRGGPDSGSLVHRGWTISYTCMHRYRSGPDVVWSRWPARKEGDDRVLSGRENLNSNCQAYGDAIRAIDEIEIPGAFS
jgi:hypothetical protein